MERCVDNGKRQNIEPSSERRYLETTMTASCYCQDNHARNEKPNDCEEHLASCHGLGNSEQAETYLDKRIGPSPYNGSCQGKDRHPYGMLKQTGVGIVVFHRTRKGMQMLMQRYENIGIWESTPSTFLPDRQQVVAFVASQWKSESITMKKNIGFQSRVRDKLLYLQILGDCSPKE